MGIYRGAGGTGDAINDSSSEALITIQARDAALAAQVAAETAQTAAQTSATNAASSATAAAGSATNAASSATSASGSASTATTQATNAANSATAAATSATNASNSASAASTSATNASNSASAAATSATNASNSASAAATSATNASNSASAAATSASNAAASYDSFDDRYLGAKSSAPTLDNDGNALLTGALYFNTTTNEMKVWSGSAWLNAYASLSGALLATNNLSDLNNTATARTNLGVAIGTNVQAWDADLDTWATKTAPSGTVVGTSDSQTLTNKTLTAPVISTISNTGTLTLPTSTDTLVGRATSDTLTNKTIALGSNTVSGTLAQFNTAVTDADLVSLAGAETLTNKTLTSPVISSISNTGTLTLPTSTDTLIGRATSDTLTNKTISGSSNTLSNIGNSSLTNSSITINGSAISLGGSVSVGTVTSVTGTSPVASSGGTTPAISLSSGYGDTQNPYASKTANYVLASPNGSSGVPTFRALVAADVPTLNQNTTGTAANVTGTVAIANGGSGQTTAQAAINAFAGAVTSGQYLRGNGTNVVMSAIQAGDVPTLNQNTTGSAATFTSTSQNSQFNSIGVGTAASGTAGEIRATNNVTAYYSSDQRLKDNVKIIENALDKVLSIRGVEFDWNNLQEAEDGYFVRKHDVGVIAQEIEQVLPEVVGTREDGIKAVKYDRIIPLLIEAIKELKTEVDALKGV